MWKIAVFLLIMSFGIFLTFGSFAWAQDCPEGITGICIPNPLKAESIPEFIETVIDALLMFAAPVAAILIIYAGFLLVISVGDPKKIGTAKKILLYAVIGLAILIAGRLIVGTVMTALDIWG